MEEPGREEQMVCADATHIAKGKRTKRLRLFVPSGVAGTVMMTSSCSSASGGDNGSFSSTTTTYESIDQEEEDMANCLILLAQGGGQTQSQSHHKQQVAEYRDDHGDGNNKTEKGSTSNRRFAEIATGNTTGANTKVGFYIYECKTCNRTFPSFQALGGHRASHKKPKLVPEEKKPQPPPPPPPQPVINNYDEFEEAGKPRGGGPTISLQLGSNGHRAFHGNKAKIHECSVCGSEFTSGQALGGHMRRHRASSSTNATADDGGVRPRNILQLDLNLPAPEDDLRESKFQFPATQKSMVLSAAPALVDCHY